MLCPRHPKPEPWGWCPEICSLTETPGASEVHAANGVSRPRAASDTESFLSNLNKQRRWFLTPARGRVRPPDLPRWSRHGSRGWQHPQEDPVLPSLNALGSIKSPEPPGASPEALEGGETHLLRPSWVTDSVLRSTPKMDKLTSVEFSQT